MHTQTVMELKRIDLRQSDLLEGHVRLAGEIAYDDGADPETWFIDVPEELEPELSRSGNPWLVWMAPLAATLGEEVRVSLPVDPLLLENMGELAAIWRCWHPDLPDLSVRAARGSTRPAADARGRVASFFSGGVDSFHTLLRHPAGRDAVVGSRVDHINDLLGVWGFDIFLDRPTGFQVVRQSMEEVAEETGKTAVTLATNLRGTRWGESDWTMVAHGCALAGAGLFLEPRYQHVLIASGAGYHDLKPWGSHPLTDRLYSTGRTTFVHDGASSDRVEKTELVSRSPVARRHLRVCYHSQEGDNCSRCSKCYRTMLTLHLLGEDLRDWPTFDGDAFDPRAVARIYSKGGLAGVASLRAVRDHAVRIGAKRIARALDRSSRRSLLVDHLADWPAVWRLAPWLRRRMLK
jgi:hypothetical protein